jgi:ribosomal protein S20
VRDKERIDTALRTYRAAVDAGDAAAAATAYERLRAAVKSAYEPCDVIAGDAGVAGWVAPW